MGQLPDTEPLLPLPAAPYPATWNQTRRVAANALASVDGNRYSVPPDLAGIEVGVRRRLGDPFLEILTPTGRVAATHRVVPRGANRTVRLGEHTAALENVDPEWRPRRGQRLHHANLDGPPIRSTGQDETPPVRG